jgi:hypothetical protein
VIKQKRKICVRHVARTEREEVYAGFCFRNLRGRDHLEDIGIEGMVMLK